MDSREVGASENNRRAKFYNLTPRGRQLAEEARRWETVAGIVERFLAPGRS